MPPVPVPHPAGQAPHGRAPATDWPGWCLAARYDSGMARSIVRPARAPSRADGMLARLADEGLRLTGQRELVVREVADRTDAFTAEGLVDELRPRGIGRATVYRTLDLLETRGMLTRMHLDKYHGYTVCDEGHHHHLVCGDCGTVIPVDATAIEAEIRKLARRMQFRLDAHPLEFAGRCADCQARAAGAAG